MKTGIELITEERKRQIEIEKWDDGHDDEHDTSELLQAAVCYAFEGSQFDIGGESPCWPWDSKWWKPTDKIRNLVKAGALIAAEIDRLQRIKSSAHPQPPPETGQDKASA